MVEQKMMELSEYSKKASKCPLYAGIHRAFSISNALLEVVDSLTVPSYPDSVSLLHTSHMPTALARQG